MRQQRTIYFNDARHYYLFVFEPPMALEDAWVPVDEVAGTAVDTFAYGVERGDGLFYPSRVGLRFGADMQPFPMAAYWRVWHNMQSLMDRGLDPLQVLVDRAHAKGMDFIASLRMGGYGGMDPAHRLDKGGRGLAHAEVRDHIFAVLRELATEYPVEGVELDLATPGGSPYLLPPEEGPAMCPVLTDYVAQISDMVRGRPGEPGTVGARVLPTEEMNLAQGLDVRAWLERGLVDFVVPLRYGYMILDPHMPIDWLVEAAHRADAAVYAMLQPYMHDESSAAPERLYPTPAQMRAAVASYWARGVDGIYTWFMRWPLGDVERRILTELGDPDLVRRGDKHYVLARRAPNLDRVPYPAPLPVEIPACDVGTRHPIPFYLADAVDGPESRVRQVRLRVLIRDLVCADRIALWLNGQSLAGEACWRDHGSQVAPYVGQWLELSLGQVRPRQGDNVLEVSLEARPAGLASALAVEQVEVLVEYSAYPTGPGAAEVPHNPSR
ncbi:MAG: hypothetical protein AB1505_00615 [Candidatus Latescibacterota bacterium]